MTRHPVAFLLLVLSACGGRVEAAAPPVEKDKDASANASPSEPADSAAPAAPVLTPPLVDDSGSASTLPMEPDAAPSPCVAAGGTCLELVGCDGIGSDLACNWSASCCLPIPKDAGACPPVAPLSGTACDVARSVTCSYGGCLSAICADAGADGGAWIVFPPCSPPPPGG